ncbi:hypothetical protein QQ045_011501 [Rhodiola kirilowii]
MDEENNRTLITLIPKKKDAVRMEDWRPINLCTVAMKIVTKIIATRLQNILDQIVSPSHSAFVKGRNIVDNFVVALEIAHFLKNCRDDGEFYASVKVDMSKAYDRVEWFFLEKVLLKLGFADKWVDRFENVSGQRINYEKLEICFSRNTPADVRVAVCSELGISQVPCHSKYLGLPLVIGQRKTESFKCIVEKIWAKVSDWKTKLLSAAGREILIKAIVQAMPVYMMSVYKFPKGVLTELNKLI